MSTKLCVVCPPGLERFQGIGDWEFIQAGWALRDHLKKKSFRIVDNQHPRNDMQTESVIRNVKAFMETAQRLEADMIICPDMLRDSETTLQQLEALANWWGSPTSENEGFKPKVMFVPQGRGIGEWIKCLWRGLREFDWLIDCIGYPKWLEQFQSRVSLLNEVGDEKDIHFLGVWTSWGEVVAHPQIDSWDMSLPISAAQGMYRLRDTFAFEDMSLSLTIKDVHDDIVYDNVAFLKERLQCA